MFVCDFRKLAKIRNQEVWYGTAAHSHYLHSSATFTQLKVAANLADKAWIGKPTTLK